MAQLYPCLTCSFAIAEDATTCPHCGTHLKENWAIPQKDSAKPPTNKELLTAVGFWVIVFASIFFLARYLWLHVDIEPSYCSNAGWVGGEWVHELYALCEQKNR